MMVSSNTPIQLKRHHAHIVIRHPSSPNILRPHHYQDAIEYGDSSLLFGPNTAMFLPSGLANQAQSPQLLPPGEVSQIAAAPSPAALPPSSMTLLPPSPAALLPSPVDPSDSMSASLRPQETLSPVSPASLTTSAISLSSATPSILPAQSQNSSPGPSLSVQPSNTPTSIVSQPQTQSITVISASSSSATEVSQPSTTSTASTSSMFPAASLSFSSSSTATPSAIESASATAAAAHSEGVPHLADIVIGIIAGIASIAFLAALASWVYKLRVRRNDRVEVASLYNDPPGGCFGCLKRRHRKSAEDMSELGFGLSHVELFGVPKFGNNHRLSSLELGSESLVQDAVKQQNSQNEPDNGMSVPHQPKPPECGFTNGPYPTLSRLPAQNRNAVLAPVDGTGSMPFGYQHVGLAGATPLTVANFAPGDLSSDEGSGEHRIPDSVRRSFMPPAPVVRHGSLGAPRARSVTPPFTRLVEGDGLATSWRPMNVSAHNMEGQYSGEERGFEPLALSRTSTLSLALSRSFSQRLGHTFSQSAGWNNEVTLPPQGVSSATRDRNEMVPEQVQNRDVSGKQQETWAETIRNNFYSALNAVGNGMGGKKAPSAASSVSTLPNPYSESSRHSSIRLPFSKSRQTQDTQDESLSPLPDRVVSRTKGSIIRGRLGIDQSAKVGLGINSFSRSSTFSTTWSHPENASEAAWAAQHLRVLDRIARRPDLLRNGTSSAVSSSSDTATFKPKARGSSRRPRCSRMEISQNTVWSSESYASSGVMMKAGKRL